MSGIQNQFAPRLAKKMHRWAENPQAHTLSVVESGSCNGNPGGAETPHFQYISHLKPSFRYGLQSGGDQQDQYARIAMRGWDRSKYEELKGFTRKPGGIKDLYEELNNFDGPSYSCIEEIPNLHYRSCLLQSIKAAREAFKLQVKPPRLTMDAAVATLKPNTAAGYPWIGRKKRDVLPDIKQAAEDIHELVKPFCGDMEERLPVEKFILPWCLVSQRGGMAKKEEPKTRLVWMYPASMLAIEARVAEPLYRAYAKAKKPLMIGQTPSAFVQDWDSDRNTLDWELLGMDIKHFDSTVHAFLIKEAFSICFDNVSPISVDSMANLRRIRESKHRNYIFHFENNKHQRIKQLLQYYFIHTPVMMPDGRSFRKHRGVPSGTYFTQIIDSIVSYIYNTFAKLLQRTVSKPGALRVLGDDSVDRILRGTFNVEQAAYDLDRALSVEVKIAKTEVVSALKDLKVLGYQYESGRAKRAELEWLQYALYPDSDVTSLDLSFSRLLGLYICGGWNSTLFLSYFRFYQQAFPIQPSGPMSPGVSRILHYVYGEEDTSKWSIQNGLMRLQIGF